MASIRSIMTPGVTVVRPDEPLQGAARRMRDLDVGALPVCDGDALVGFVTDRDITIRAVAEAMDPKATQVAEVMTGDPISCTESDPIDVVMARMGDAQVRRIAVLDANRRIVGIVSLGDMATRQPAPTDEALREISAPDAKR